MSVEENKQIVRNWIEYMVQQDYEKIADLLAENFQWIIPVRAAGLQHIPLVRDKTLSIVRFKANRGLMTEGMRLTPFAWTAEGDRVAVECEGTVTWNTGQVYNNLYHLAFVIRNGKIERFTEYCDYLYAWETNPLLHTKKQVLSDADLAATRS